MCVSKRWTGNVGVGTRFGRLVSPLARLERGRGWSPRATTARGGTCHTTSPPAAAAGAVHVIMLGYTARDHRRRRESGVDPAPAVSAFREASFGHGRRPHAISQLSPPPHSPRRRLELLHTSRTNGRRISPSPATPPPEMKRRHLPPVLLLLLFFLSSLLPPLPAPVPDPVPIRRGGPAPPPPRRRRRRRGPAPVRCGRAPRQRLDLHLPQPRQPPPPPLPPPPVPQPRHPGPPRPRAVARLRVPFDGIPSDTSLLAAFRASLRSFLLARRRRRRGGTVAGVMTELPGLLGHGRRRFPTCAVVGNSGILLGSGRGAQIDAHDLVVRLNNARVAGFAADVGAKTSLSFVNSNILHTCATRSAISVPGCGCHPYGRAVPMAMYVCQPVHLLDALVCNATATPESPFPLIVTDVRLDALCARIAKYYSMRRFMVETGEPASNWTRRHDERYFHYSSGLQAVVMALGVCDEVSVFGFGKAAGAKHHYHTNQKKELDLHDYEAEYQFYRDLQTRPAVVPFLDEAPGFKLPPVKMYW
ncbi:hypothetical protein PR202_gb16405 [Eleusine coracana subsp. coracana]|uniref:Sialyltransferase-like protein n=1 Tax=Eleusine coracana subsp. coracana TaxID=191504 RepID=A0AAV5F0X7_ELECO|nr:hypothetical protein PR202_gb16405 [Eleusine coracana subsp. coracana]